MGFRLPQPLLAEVWFWIYRIFLTFFCFFQEIREQFGGFAHLYCLKAGFMAQSR